MEEKEMVKRIKTSLKNHKTREQITRTLLDKGYKLEYINHLIKKARPISTGKIILAIFILALIGTTTFLAYKLFLPTTIETNFTNPLQGILVKFSQQINPQTPQENQTEIYIDDIKITPDFLSYLLQEIGAGQLHKNPLTQNPTIINFQIDSQTFYSTITNTITTQEGLSNNADIQFNTNKEVLVTAIISEQPAEIFKNSFQDGTTTLDQLKGETTLFAKGYLELYNSLNN